MAGNMSTYSQANVCNWFKGTAYPATVANIYVALFTTVPNQAGAGGVEVSGTGYARKAIPTATGFNAPTGTTNQPYALATSGVTDFGTAGSNWGTIVGAGYYDGATGNLLHVETFTSSVVVTSGLPVSFAAGALTVTVSSPSISKYLALAYLNWYRGTAFPAAPTNVYAALFTTMPNQDGTSGVEVSGTGYARQAIAASTGWSALTGTNPTQITNAAVLNWGSAGSAWGTVLGEGLYDAVTAGNLLGVIAYGAGQAVNNGAAVTQAVGNVAVAVD